MSSNTARRQSPLAAFMSRAEDDEAVGPAGVVISERPYLGHLNLRGDPADGEFMGAVERTLGFALPAAPNTVFCGEEVLALWLGPDEWLIITPQDGQGAVEDALNAALEGAVASVTDVTGGQTVINISGRNARDALDKGCTLDLHPRAFGERQCAQTLVAGVGVTLRWVDDTPSFDLVVRRSFAEHLALWLRDAALEYGAAVG